MNLTFGAYGMNLTFGAYGLNLREKGIREREREEREGEGDKVDRNKKIGRKKLKNLIK